MLRLVDGGKYDGQLQTFVNPYCLGKGLEDKYSEDAPRPCAESVHDLSQERSPLLANAKIDIVVTNNLG